jgi:hypothetical protein
VIATLVSGSHEKSQLQPSPAKDSDVEIGPYTLLCSKRSRTWFSNQRRGTSLYFYKILSSELNVPVTFHLQLSQSSTSKLFTSFTRPTMRYGVYGGYAARRLSSNSNERTTIERQIAPWAASSTFVVDAAIVIVCWRLYSCCRLSRSGSMLSECVKGRS